MLTLFWSNKLVCLSSCLVMLIAVVFRDRIVSVYEDVMSHTDPSKLKHNTNPHNYLYSVQQLAEYDGITKKQLYLAVLGVVFDVTKGSKHYEKGAPYHFFVGRDGSRALITGNFSDASNEQDHILDLSCDDIFVIVNWKNTFKQRYTNKGKLIGRYYDENGAPTEYNRQLKRKLKQCQIAKEQADQKEQQFPPCNIEWSVIDGTRVWCTKSSGGVIRNWTGVPRQLYSPGKEKPQCVCVELTTNKLTALLKEYKECEPTSTTCFVKNIE